MVDHGFLLPVRRGTAMFRSDGTRLTECSSTYRETLYDDWFAVLETDTDVRVRLAPDAHPNAARYVFEQWRGAFDGEPSLLRSVPIPTSFVSPTPRCALKDNVLFVGGTLEAGRLVSFDLEAPAARWGVLAPLADPQERNAHSNVCAVCIDGDRLLCIDTVLGHFDPRWLVFDVSNPRDVYPKRTVAIEPGTESSRREEYVEQMIVSGPYVVVQTRSQFVDGWQYWLRFFDRATLRELGHMAQSRLDSWLFSEAPAIAGSDELLVECRKTSLPGVRLYDLRAIDLEAFGAIAPSRAIRCIEKAQRSPRQAHFVDGARLVVVWRAADGAHDVTLESLADEIPRESRSTKLE